MSGASRGFTELVTLRESRDVTRICPSVAKCFQTDYIESWAEKTILLAESQSVGEENRNPCHFSFAVYRTTVYSRVFIS